MTNGFVTLKGKFYYLSLQPITAKTLKGKFVVKHSASRTLKVRFTVKHNGAADPKGKFNIRRTAVGEDKHVLFKVQHSSSGTLKATLFIPQDDYISVGLTAQAYIALSILS